MWLGLIEVRLGYRYIGNAFTFLSAAPFVHPVFVSNRKLRRSKLETYIPIACSLVCCQYECHCLGPQTYPTLVFTIVPKCHTPITTQMGKVCIVLHFLFRIVLYFLYVFEQSFRFSTQCCGFWTWRERRWTHYVCTIPKKIHDVSKIRLKLKCCYQNRIVLFWTCSICSQQISIIAQIHTVWKHLTQLYFYHSKYIEPMKKRFISQEKKCRWWDVQK